MNTILTVTGVEVGCRYRWPQDGSHPNCWQPPLKGVVLEQSDPRAWMGTLAFPCRDGALPDAEKVKAMELPPEGDFRTPAVTSMPGGGEPILKILVREVNFVFAFGLLVIGLRFILRSLLAIAGWVKVDPNAAHGDEEMAHAHDHSAQADLVETAIKETSR